MMVITILTMNMMAVVSSFVIEESTTIIDNDQGMIELPSKEEKDVTKSLDTIDYSTKMLRSTTRLISIEGCPTGRECTSHDDCFPCKCTLIHLMPPFFTFACV